MLADRGEPVWQQSLRDGTRALVAGRLNACERLNMHATELSGAEGDPAGRRCCTVQLALLRREQGRPAEAELAARGLPPGDVLTAILVDLGRDSEAWAELTAWSRLAEDRPLDDDDADGLAEAALFGEVAATLGDRAVARRLYERLLPYEDRFAADDAGAACHGSVARQLGLLAHRLDDWETARRHFDVALVAHVEAGAPILLAHTRRQYAALLRVRGGAGDWDRAVELLGGAEDIYRRLGIEPLAGQCQSVLARSDLTDAATTPGERRVVNLFRSDDNGWLVRYAGSEARVADERGLRDVAHLLARPAQSLHVADLLLEPDSPARGVGTAASAGVASPWRSRGVARLQPPQALDEQARAEHRARLSELDAEANRLDQGGDAIEVALSSAERDRIEALLADQADALELAREAVSTRIRLGVEAVARAHSELGRHLRRSIRTGTFCSYEPPARTMWDM